MKAVKYIVFFGNFYQVIVYDFFQTKNWKNWKQRNVFSLQKTRVPCFLEPVFASGFIKPRAGLCLKPGESMCCVLGQDTGSSSPPRSRNGYRLIVWKA